MSDEEYTFIGPLGGEVNDAIKEDRRLSAPELNKFRPTDSMWRARIEPVKDEKSALKTLQAIGVGEAREKEGRGK